MTFFWPHLLWLLLVPAALLTWELLARRRAAGAATHPKILRAAVGHHDLSLVGRSGAGTRRAAVRVWLLLGLTFAIFALARPQWGRIEEPAFDQSREILLAIDLSRSMLTPDVKPSRLERSKLLIQALLEKLKGERVGLVVFSGTAFLQSPLSADYEILREFLPNLNPSFLPEGGTNYRALLETSLDAFGQSNAADRFLIVLSDGEATDDDWKGKIDDLKHRGVRVIGLGVGTAAGAMIPDGSGGFVKDDRGAVVLSKLESGTLQQLASATGGVYRDASGWIDLASLIEQTVNTGKKGNFVDKNTVRHVDRFQWPLAFAVWCLLMSFYYELPVKPRARDIALRPSPRPSGSKSASSTPPPPLPAPPAGTVAVALLTLLLLCGIRSLQAAVKIAPPTTGAPTTAHAAPPALAPSASAPLPGGAADGAALGKIVGRLAEKPALSAADLSELAYGTLDWGRQLKAASQPVPAGPVRDALKAVDELQARKDTFSDWSQLRGELEALLQPPPPPPPQPQKQPPQDKSDQQKQQNQSDQPKSSDAQDRSKPSDPSQPDQKPQDQPQSDRKDGAQNSPPKAGEQKQPPPGQSAFGDMSKPTPPPPQPPAPQPSSEMQKVGGTTDQKPEQPADAALAVPMQKLDQLRNQDTPAELYRMMQAEQRPASPQKPKKDW